ncbi:hypothetical protein AB0O91_23590 [Kitasatospora sp. NPDC089797]|uniref:hypothetical protein n=1 Tax=Kitasatospora sp. NPDC089797 TaxID=3155298 RepID=UPI0034180738
MTEAESAHGTGGRTDQDGKTEKLTVCSGTADGTGGSRRRAGRTGERWIAVTDPSTPAAGAAPAGAPDAPLFMLDGPTIPLPWGHGVKLAPVFSTAQTNVSAGDLVAAFGKHDVKIELDTLTAFAKKIEALLAAMEGSEAAPYKLAAQNVSQQNLVSGDQAHQFVEAVALSSTYEKVHTQLVKLHKDFTAQIKAMQKAVTSTAQNYSTNEDNATDDQNAVAKNAGLTGTSGPGSKRTGADGF